MDSLTKESSKKEHYIHQYPAKGEERDLLIRELEKICNLKKNKLF